MRALSKPQQKFLAELRAAGTEGVRCPFLGNRYAKIAVSAFHRTAESLRKLTLVRIERDGDSIRVFLVTQQDLVKAVDRLTGCSVELPWDDCKVAFSYDGADADDKLFARLCSDDHQIPDGWEFDELDCSGARVVAVFRVEGVPLSADGRRVRAVLDAIACEEKQAEAQS